METTAPRSAKTLMQHMEEVFAAEYSGSGFAPLGEILKDDDKAAGFIRGILNDDTFGRVGEDNDDGAENGGAGQELFEFAKTRARHSAITYLVGLVFFNSFGIGAQIAKSFCASEDDPRAKRLWMLTSLYHDWGYFSKDIANAEFEIESLRYPLLTEEYAPPLDEAEAVFRRVSNSTLAYSYKEIIAYWHYALMFHADNEIPDEDGKKIRDPEKVDHGILSGVKVFNKLVGKMVKSGNAVDPEEFSAVKTACLTAAQHNIYKSPNEDKDRIYGDELKRLHSGSELVIDHETPLLLLLSLVDTFECVKRFGKGKKADSYFQTATILNNISLELHSDRIEIDYSELEKQLTGKGDSLKKKYNNYKKTLCGLGSWVCFTVKQDPKEDSKIVITAGKP